MGLRDRLRHLERAAEGEVAVLMCEECGEELRVRDGIELDLVAEGWAEEQRRRGRAELVYGETPEDVKLINDHPCGWTALRHKGSGEKLPQPVSSPPVPELPPPTQQQPLSS